MIIAHQGRLYSMAIHDEILSTVRRLCRTRKGWTFSVREVVEALPHLNPRSVRTHIVSRCCVDAPAHHAHRWPYFDRVGRGVYRIRPEFRLPRSSASVGADPSEGAMSRVAEFEAMYAASTIRLAVRDTIHVFVVRDGETYVAEAMEVPVVTQAHGLDAVARNVREAVALHLDGEDRAALGLAERLRITLSYDMPVGDGAKA